MKLNKKSTLSAFFIGIFFGSSFTFAASICSNSETEVRVRKELLNSPISIRADLGNSMAALGNANDIELKLYRQGWNHLHNFMYVDAIRSFKTASLTNSNVELQMSLALSYLELGVMDDFQNLKKEISKNLKETDANYQAHKIIFELIKYFGGDDKVDKKLLSNQKTTLAAMNNLSDFQLYFAFKFWDEEVILATYQKGKYSSAEHYLTHINEGRSNSVAAEKYAGSYAKTAQGSAHAQHMHGHVLPLLGRWAEAISEFQKADQLHLQWQAENKAKPEDDWHYAHNLDLMAASYFHTKQLDKAETTYKRLCSVKPFEVNCYHLVEFYLSVGRPKEAGEVLWMYYMPHLPDAFGDKKLDQATKVRANILNLELKLRSLVDKDETIKQAKVFIEKYKRSKGAERITDEFELLETMITLTAFAQGDAGIDGKNLEQGILSKMQKALSSPGFDGWSRGAIITNRIITYAESLNINFAQGLRAQFEKKMFKK
jgi:tetratricopeptide (TPR) repeat protein